MSDFEQNFKEFMRQQRGGNRGSARDMLRALGLVSLIASAAFWYPVQWTLVGPTDWRDAAIAIAFGTFVSLGPPVFVSFFVPWSPAAQLLVKINAKTWGQAIALACSLFLVYYAGQVLFAWWMARPVAAGTGMVEEQMILGLIATVISPALLWAPVSSDELEEILKQNQVVRRYELQVQLDMAYLQSMVLEAQRATAGGLAGVIAEHGGPSVAEQLRWLLGSMDQTIGEIAHTVGKTSKTVAAFPSLSGQQGTVQVLDYVEDTLRQITAQPIDVTPVVREARPAAPAAPAPRPAVPPQQDAESTDRPTDRERPARAVTARSGPAPDGRELPDAVRAAVRALGRGAWTRADLQEALSISKSTAGDRLTQWRGAGWVEELTESGGSVAYRYRFSDAVLQEVG